MNVQLSNANLSPVPLAVAGLPDPRSEGEMVNGTSLGPLFDNPHAPIRFENGVNAAFSQFMKVSAWNVLNGFQRNATKIAGYSIRVDRWRYSEWFAMDVACTSSGASYPDRGPHAGPDRVSERPQETQGCVSRVLTDMEPLGVELYAHDGGDAASDGGDPSGIDPDGEHVNVASDPRNAAVIAELRPLLLAYIRLPRGRAAGSTTSQLKADDDDAPLLHCGPSQNCTNILQAAIDGAVSTGGIVSLAPGVWTVVQITLRSNLRLQLAAGTTLMAQAGAFHDGAAHILSCEGLTNVTVRGAVGGGSRLVMRKADYINTSLYTHSEGRHAVELMECTHIVLSDLYISDTGGKPNADFRPRKFA